MKKLNVILSLIMFGFLLNSCNNDNAQASYPYSVSMTDAPGPYQQVNVDVIGVEIKGEGSESITLNVIPGIYDLLKLSNGVEKLIATDTLEISKISQIRLILGTRNTVVLDGITYPLSTPSAEQSGLKLQVHQTLQEGIMYHVLLDFDANKSIVKLGNGGYKLKPVIRTVETAISGAIKGTITPIGALAVATATNLVTLETYSTNVNVEGKFLVMGLPAGKYSLTITPDITIVPALKEVKVDNIDVEIGQTKIIAAISLL
ncbi:protein of unknown function [Flavobacterium gillisiae]|uniref:DUF4382 domain-containing protein n=1 Tax=Flavobacterium gillisiae TaxID=150146 RepID=A0A1H3ZWY1_9FLAO|nr:DUF4382 domain-containing protein [Flavobacterium gillisiae]SEA27814.1 protein of unknown function [Flavobacterium gillisiae]